MQRVIKTLPAASRCLTKHDELWRSRLGTVCLTLTVKILKCYLGCKQIARLDAFKAALTNIFICVTVDWFNSSMDTQCAELHNVNTYVEEVTMLRTTWGWSNVSVGQQGGWWGGTMCVVAVLAYSSTTLLLCSVLHLRKNVVHIKYEMIVTNITVILLPSGITPSNFINQPLCYLSSFKTEWFAD